MFCVNCGVKVVSDTRFCASCGTPIVHVAEADSTSAPATPPQPASAESAPYSPPDNRNEETLPKDEQPLLPPLSLGTMLPDWLRERLTSGWGEAVRGAGLAAAVVFGVGLGVAIALRFAAGEDWAAIGAVLPVYKLAGLVSFLLARVSLGLDGVIDTPFGTLGGTGEMVVGLLSGVAVAAAALFAGGRYSARVAGVDSLRSGLIQGAKVGPVYAFIGLFGALIVRSAGESVSLGPSLGSAFWWSLVLGTGFGALGGVSRAGGRRWLLIWARSIVERGRDWGYAIVGALAGLRLGFLLVGIVGLGLAVFASTVAGFSDSVGELSLWGWLGVVVAVVLLVPNILLGLFALAHGGTFRVGLTGLGLPEFGLVRINYFSYPTEAASDILTTGPVFATAPWYWFLLLLIPAAAVFIAGYQAAAMAGVSTVEHARRVGSRVGIPYAVVVWLLSYVAQFRISGDLFVDVERVSGSLSAGVSQLGAFFLPLIWGSVGGMLGATYHLRSAARAAPSGSSGGVRPPHVPTKSTGGTSAVPSETKEAGSENNVCRNCGADNRKQNRFCVRCGEPLPTASEE